MKILKYVLFLLLIVFVGGSLYLATLDGNYDVHRARVIKAPVEVVFETVNDYKTWKYWSPWLEVDSTIVYTFPENSVGVGATYSWKGTSGDGSIENLAVILNESIDNEIYFDGQGNANGYWRFVKTNVGVEVTWGMKGQMPFLARFMASKMETEVGPMFERGLELLENYVQKGMKEFSIESVGAVDYGGGYYLYQTTSCRFDEIGSKMHDIIVNLETFMKANRIESSGKIFTINHKWDEVMQTAIFSTCIPIKERVILTDNTILVGLMESQRTFKTILKGDYSNSFTAWETAYKNLADQGFVTKLKGEPFEVYITNPQEIKNPAKWVTEIYIPIE